MICPSCGKESGTESPFCTYCGANLSFVGHKLDDEKRRLKEAIGKRERTDRTISPWFVALPLVINVVISVAVVAAVLSVVFSYDLSSGDVPENEELFRDLEGVIVFAFFAGALFYGLFAVLTYVLIDNTNKHIEAEKDVRAAIVALLKKVHGEKPEAEPMSPWKTYGDVPEGDVPHKPMNPIVWSLVILIPLLGSGLQLSAMLNGDYDSYNGYEVLAYPLILLHVVLMFYLLHMISLNASSHDVDWTDFATDARISLARAGAAAGDLDVGSYIPARPSALYAILSFITGGLFLFFWWYTIIKDANSHFNKQAWFEENLARMLSSPGPQGAVRQA